jgi:hypothetical protein
MDNGIPQGSVLSCTLFNIVFNDILNKVESPVKYCAYADDLVLFISGNNTKVIEQKSQQALTKLKIDLNNNGLEISKDKTKGIYFTRQFKKNINKPKIMIDSHNIEIVDNYKFLGIILDFKLKWSQHVTYITAKTKNNINLIKMLSNTKYGSDRKTLLKIHEALTTSIHNYGALIFTNITKKDEQRLNSVHIRCLKYAIGAYVTTPNISTQIEAGVLPLKHQRTVNLIK